MATSGGPLVDAVERNAVDFQSIQEKSPAYVQHYIDTVDALPADSTIDNMARLE